MTEGRDYRRLALEEVVLVDGGKMTAEQAYGLSKLVGLPVIMVPDWTTVSSAKLDELQRIIDGERERRHAEGETHDDTGEAVLLDTPVADGAGDSQ